MVSQAAQVSQGGGARRKCEKGTIDNHRVSSRSDSRLAINRLTPAMRDDRDASTLAAAA